MDIILSGQNIEKRRYSSSSPLPLPHPVKKTSPSAVSNLGNITQRTISARGQTIHQPVKRVSAEKREDFCVKMQEDLRRRRKSYAGMTRTSPSAAPSIEQRISLSKAPRKKMAKSHFSFTFSFLQTIKMLSYPLGFIALTLIVSFLAMNKDKLSRSVVNPGEDNAYRSAMEVYAGISGPEVLRENINLEDVPIPLDLMETFSWREYTIQRGDSISAIAAASSLSMDAVIALNDISNAKRIREGSVIRIPNMDGIPYTVQRGDNLSRISARFDVPLEAILDANDLDSEVISAGTSLFIPGARMAREDLKRALGEFFLYPTNGRLSSSFGWRPDPFTGVRRHHAAIDLASPIGTPIKASSDGTISVVGTNAIYGKYMIITHSGGYNTMYAHLDKIYLEKGSRVLQGTVIGEVGNTGKSTGPHLHFGVFKNGRAVNPLEYLSR